MATACILYGPSGAGKSFSLRNFASDEVSLVKCLKKPLPFRKVFDRTVCTADYQTVIGLLTRSTSKIIVIDDAGYLLTAQFMAGHSAPGNKFDLYNNIADNVWKLMNTINEKMPEDTIVYLMFHEEANDSGQTGLRTIGKLLNQKVCIEGMVTIALRCMTDGVHHWFSTQNNGNDISKSPEGMFEPEIENDLKIVDDKIRAYYNFKSNTTPVKTKEATNE